MIKKFISWKILVLALFFLGVILYTSYYLSINKYLDSFLLAINNENCNNIYPLTQIKNLNKDAVCPRGDVGNFMVVDKVEYIKEGVLGVWMSNSRQVLLRVCVTARGEAAWNEGKYQNCSVDPQIITFKLGLFHWYPVVEDFTNISQLLSRAGERPSNLVFEPGVGYYPIVNGTVDYAIKTHKLPIQGVAH